MGSTYRGTRRKFGTKKTRDHNARSKWTASNGTRLRSLQADLEMLNILTEDTGTGISLHVPEMSEKATRKISKLLETVEEAVRPQLKIVKKAAHNVSSELWNLPTNLLQMRKSYAIKQTILLNKMINHLKWSAAGSQETQNRLLLRKKQWDTSIGTIGLILKDRAGVPEND